ncbi:hypothetical protein K458DRAFT_438815 [Lentithecium fluviatile CBS 122367]|uniref:Uncharacterized protein n=1 Tax=Lentithecium fluviatile CBS 122367 TaxID=1168545 RepID=A0A6G1JLM8_9PLEO|nr:hypothetical protein K458DRAFT_438815 [Lentithecium fluviatile CBS 122367]
MAANSVDDSFSDDVFTGFWINRAYGSCYGATLTLRRQHGGFLIAFLAIYVSLTGKSFWKIARFLLHSYFSSAATTDGVYHQRQNVLRNAKAAPDAVAEVFWIMLAWRPRARRTVSRLMFVMVVAFFVTAGFVTAGVFSSRVAANSSNEVILLGSGCGTQVSAPFGQETADLLNYRQRRILEHLITALQCQTFMKPRLPYTVDINSSCPFSDKICRRTSGNILLDTGLLDSSEDFGINAGPRFRVRMKRHCAPLTTNGFSHVYTDPEHPADKFMRYTYGRANYTIVANEAENAFVYEVPIKEAPTYVDPKLFYRSEMKDYKIGSDGEVVILFLSSDGLWYRERTDDPWFAANQEVPASDELGFGNGTKVFLPDEPAGVIGCSFTTWLCNLELPESQIWPDTNDRAAIVGFMSAITTFTTSPDFVYRSPGLPSLLSRFTLVGPVQAGMAAATQKGAFWPTNKTHCPTPKACQVFCRNQKIRSPNFYSFSVLGVSVVIFLGLFLILVATWIESIVASILRCRGRSVKRPTFAMLEWENNSALQLQRLALQAVGSGTWTRTAQSVPVTEAGDTLGTLDISDPTHTRLRRLSPEHELSNMTPYEGSDVDNGLASPEIIRGDEEFTAARTRSSPMYMIVATQEDR